MNYYVQSLLNLKSNLSSITIPPCPIHVIIPNSNENSLIKSPAISSVGDPDTTLAVEEVSLHTYQHVCALLEECRDQLRTVESLNMHLQRQLNVAEQAAKDRSVLSYHKRPQTQDVSTNTSLPRDDDENHQTGLNQQVLLQRINDLELALLNSKLATLTHNVSTNTSPANDDNHQLELDKKRLLQRIHDLELELNTRRTQESNRLDTQPTTSHAGPLIPIQPNLDLQLEAKLRLDLSNQIRNELESQFHAQLISRVRAEVELSNAQIINQYQAQLDSRTSLITELESELISEKSNSLKLHQLNANISSEFTHLKALLEQDQHDAHLRQENLLHENQDLNMRLEHAQSQIRVLQATVNQIINQPPPTNSSFMNSQPVSFASTNPSLPTNQPISTAATTPDRKSMTPSTPHRQPSSHLRTSVNSQYEPSKPTHSVRQAWTTDKQVPVLPASTADAHWKSQLDAAKQLEHQLRNLQSRKEELQASYVRIPMTSTAINRRRKEDLDSQLDQVDREIGSVKRRLKTMNFL